MFKKKNNKGFTLVELLVVIAIIGILAVVAVPALFKNIEKGKVADLEADISAVRSAVLSYYANESDYPVDKSDVDRTSTTQLGIVELKQKYASEPNEDDNYGTFTILSELEGLSFPYGGSYKLTDNDGDEPATAPGILYMTITTKDANTMISEDGLDKLAKDLGLDRIPEPESNVVNSQPQPEYDSDGTKMFIGIENGKQKVIIPLIKN